MTIADLKFKYTMLKKDYFYWKIVKNTPAQTNKYKFKNQTFKINELLIGLNIHMIDNEIIDDFLLKISSKKREENLILLKNNLQRLLLIKTNEETLNKWFPEALAIYNTPTNQILYTENQEYLYHELFHMATTYSCKDNYHCGFCITNKKTKKRSYVALNEFYTAHLTEKYFDGKPGGYPECKWIGKFLEKIIGEETMENLYLNADTKGLIKELEKTYSKEEIIDFLNKIEKLYYVVYLKDYNEENHIKITNELISYYNKAGIYLEQKFISYDEYEKTVQKIK